MPARTDKKSKPGPRAGWLPPALAVGAGIAFFLIFASAAELKYRSFSFGDIDLALLNQTSWNAAQGKLTEGAPGQAVVFNGGHVFIVLILLAPLYALFDSPLFLLTVQALALALGAWPVYLLARDRLGKAFAPVFALAYLVYPAMNFVCLFEFHAVALATPLLLAAGWALSAGRYRAYWLWLALALACREDVAIPAAALGVFALVSARELSPPRRKRHLLAGALTLAVAVLWLGLCLKLIQPAFRPAVVEETEAAQAGMSFYGWLGSTPGEILGNILRQPGRLLGAVFSGPKLLYVYHLLVPTVFLALLSPAGFFAFAVALAEALLSSRFSHYSIRYQYSSIVTPLVFLGAVYGMRNLLRLLPKGRIRLLPGAILLGAALVSSWSLGPLFKLGEIWPTWRYTPEDAVRDRMVIEVGPGEPVIASFGFAPKLSSRPWLFYFYHLYAVSSHPNFRIEIPPAREKAQKILVDFDDWLTFYDFYTPGGDLSVAEFLREGNWQMQAQVNSLALFRRGDSPAPGALEPLPEGEGAPFRALPGVPGLEVGAARANRGEELGFPVLKLELALRAARAGIPDALLVARLASPAAPERFIQQNLMGPYRIHPFRRWRAGDSFRIRANLLLPGDLPPGSWDLQVIGLSRRPNLPLHPQASAAFYGHFDAATALNLLPRIWGIPPDQLLNQIPVALIPGALEIPR